jgi:2-C-methyl-D-erythritol 4-phosphate cytidylyltransferase/2-C-methyl-D-erythritol 2,4-cyclodiphosphate synthase
MLNAALIVAAGTGDRAKGAGDGPPKQFRLVGGKPVLRWSVESFARHPRIGRIQVVIRDADQPLYNAAVSGLDLAEAALGGATRQQSVRNGLEAMTYDAPARVLIHDAARPFVSMALIDRVLDALEEAEASAPLLPVVDTLRRESANGYEAVSRTGLVRAQTPQGFDFAAILAAHRRFETLAVTDDMALAERAGLSFRPAAGEEANIKLTGAEDFALAERLARAMRGETRCGTGFDVHRFVAGDHVWLCGIRVPHGRGLEGHSDADVGLHALTDALLGACGEGDIGQHFPPSDERWRGAPSDQFLSHAVSLVREKGGTVAHVDVTLICEAPKIAPYREAMRQRLAALLGIGMDRVSVKATTTEGLGFTGRGEGMAAQAIATIRLPE